jgi:DNA-binding CsgD family transcriptional regulator
MATQSVGPKSQPVRHTAVSAEQMLKQLVAHAVELAGDGIAGDGARTEEVLLDMDLDGARYMLLRLPKPETPRVQLSPREQEIVRMVAQGHCNKVIAGVLSISSWTVCTHLRRIFAKLGVGSRAAMIARFMETHGSAAHMTGDLNGSEMRSQTFHGGSPGTASARARRSA